MSIKSIRGLRSYYPTDKGPVDAYQLGRNGRVEYLAAEIAVDHLNKGKDTTDEWRKWAKEKGNATDEPGLILSHRLGGSGTDQTNLFPKSPLLDDTIWKQHEQEAVEEASEMKKWKKIKFSIRLDYPSEESTRPSALEYQYDLPSGTILYGKVNNTPAPSTATAPEEEEVEEEEEEEEEAEEEEEEEEEEEVVEASSAQSVTESKVEENEPEKPKQDPANEEPEIPSPNIIVVVPPTPRPSIYEYETSPSPPESPTQPTPPTITYELTKVTPAVQNDRSQTEPGEKKQTAKDTMNEQERGIITKSDVIDLIPVIGSCKLAIETIKAAYNGNGRTALRKAVQCGISLVADFYLGRAIARHGQILSSAVTEQTVIRFVTKAENQIIVVSTFKATNQLLSTLSRALS